MLVAAGLSWVAPRTKAFVPFLGWTLFLCPVRKPATTEPRESAAAHECDRPGKDGMMGSHDMSTEPQVHNDGEQRTTFELHIRQVEDRALPARQVLLQQTQDREPDDRGPIFVP
jgi:hypothetical protein